MSALLDPSRLLWRNHGGLHLPEHKTLSNQRPTRPISASTCKELVVPLLQHAGMHPDILVKVGESVNKGQPLAKSQGYASLPIHASTSGLIRAIEKRPIPHPSGLEDTCIIIEPDGADHWGAHKLEPLPHYAELDGVTLRSRICFAGIVGLGGAVFPAAIKLNVRPKMPISTLIINGAECEPYITCDDLLMREKPEEIIAGAQVILHILLSHTPPEGQECLIGIEDNKPEAIQAMQAAVKASGDQRIHIVPIPTLYPSGGEKQLIKILTGREVASGSRPTDSGVICHNVATARAIYRAVVWGEPLISRYITVTGVGVAEAQNFEVPFGVPIRTLIEQAGGYTDKAERLIMGGPMMGISLANDSIPVVKASNCILVEQAANKPAAQPCIRCGACAAACPVTLLPQQLYWHARAKHFEEIEKYHLFDCIECGCCAYVCPSHLPLVDYYRFAKSEIRHQRQVQHKADVARERHEFRLERLERAKREKAEKLAKHKQALQNKSATKGDDAKQAAIQAALERAKAKKEKAQQTPLTPNEDKSA